MFSYVQCEHWVISLEFNRSLLIKIKLQMFESTGILFTKCLRKGTSAEHFDYFYVENAKKKVTVVGKWAIGY
jgi:hypothetical protein